MKDCEDIIGLKATPLMTINEMAAMQWFVLNPSNIFAILQVYAQILIRLR